MYEPFPLVGDPSQQDMKQLRGKPGYKNYNAYYVPVTSLDPTNCDCLKYYPCQEGETPMYDEYVIFNPSQALPRFWIQLVVEAPFLRTLDTAPLYISNLIFYLIHILQTPQIQSNETKRLYIKDVLTYLFKQREEDRVEDHQLSNLYPSLKEFMDQSLQVKQVATNALPKIALSASPTHREPFPSHAAEAAKSASRSELDLRQSITPSLNVTSAAVMQDPLSPLSSIAFGAAKWEYYFGLQCVEPALPPDIHDILSSPCPFFPSKTVAETHLLTLVPENMTLEKLEAYTLNAKQGNKIGFNDKDEKCTRLFLSQLGKISSGPAHWVLMPKDVIPESRTKSWKSQQATAKKYESQGYKLLSILDAAHSILLEYVQTGRRFYSDKPWTYTRCSEQVLEESFPFPALIGGFSPQGICFFFDADTYRGYGLSLSRTFN